MNGNGLGQHDARLQQQVAQFAPAPLLVTRQGRDTRRDPCQLLGRGQAVL